MKRLNFSNRLRPMAIMAACAMMLSAVSCSNDEDSLLAEFESPGKLVQEIDGEIDFEYLEGLAKGEVMMEYSRDKTELYHRDLFIDSKWRQPKSDMDGMEIATPKSFIIGRGKCHTLFKLWACSGPHPLAMPWNAYLTATGKNLRLYLEAPLTVSQSDRDIILDNRTCRIEQFTRNSIVLSYVTPTIIPGKNWMHISQYIVSDATFTFDQTCLSFSSKEELYKTVIAMLREQFGETINLNEWSSGTIYDDPIINISDLEWILSFE